MPLNITEPGVYDIPESDYHRDPMQHDGGSLSCTEIKRLTDCPAKFNYWRHNGEEHKDVFDFGKAAHAEVLGVGADVEVVDFDDWRSKAAQEARKEFRALGRTPLLRKDWNVVLGMAAEIKAHPLAMKLLDRPGKAEQSAFWKVDDLWRRCRFDFLPDVPASGRLIIPDYKTAPSSKRVDFEKAVANFGYHQQDAWYSDGARSTLDVEDVAFVFIVQEKTAPYVVNVIELTESARNAGEWRNEQAVELFRRCRESGIWPGYSDEVERASLPRWAEMELEADMEMAQ